MGIIKAVKIGALLADAERARTHGKRIFVARMSDSPNVEGMASSLPTISEMIEGIETKGWVLDRLTGGHESDGGRTILVGMFRVAETRRLS
jgi:hypothetical protein